MPKEKEEEIYESYLTFLLGENRLAIPVPYVQEVIGKPKLTLIPSVPRFVEGLSNVRGEVIPIVNTSFFLELPKHTRRFERTILLRKEEANVGLLVHEVLQVVHLNPQKIQKENLDPKLSPYLLGTYLDEGKIFLVLLPEVFF